MFRPNTAIQKQKWTCEKWLLNINKSATKHTDMLDYRPTDFILQMTAENTKWPKAVCTTDK
jgi:hypothetical protein